MRQFCAHFLFILSGWTLLIKWILPAVWAVHEGVPVSTYIFWDFWWVVHIWLGTCLLRGARSLFAFVMVVSLMEITIIVTIFVLFFLEPNWTLWTMNWFVNKCFVLACFVVLLVHALNRKNQYQH